MNNYHCNDNNISFNCNKIYKKTNNYMLDSIYVKKETLKLNGFNTNVYKPNDNIIDYNTALNKLSSQLKTKSNLSRYKNATNNLLNTSAYSIEDLINELNNSNLEDDTLEVSSIITNNNNNKKTDINIKRFSKNGLIVQNTNNKIINIFNKDKSNSLIGFNKISSIREAFGCKNKNININSSYYTNSNNIMKKSNSSASINSLNSYNSSNTLKTSLKHINSYKRSIDQTKIIEKKQNIVKSINNYSKLNNNNKTCRNKENNKNKINTNDNIQTDIYEMNDKINKLNNMSFNEKSSLRSSINYEEVLSNFSINYKRNMLKNNNNNNNNDKIKNCKIYKLHNIKEDENDEFKAKETPKFGINNIINNEYKDIDNINNNNNYPNYKSRIYK